MKSIWLYVSFQFAFISTGLAIGLWISNKGSTTVQMILSILHMVVAVICWYKFIAEYSKDRKIDKEGKFVQGTLIKESVKSRLFFREMYIVRASVSYHDEKTGKTLTFSGRDFIHYRTLEKALKHEDIVVLVGYLEQDESKSIVYLGEALERVV